MSQYRYGIGEWFGRSFAHMSTDERRVCANTQLRPRKDRPRQVCAFRSFPGREAPCTKDGGVCSLRLYELRSDGTVGIAPDDAGRLCATCPGRFEQGGLVYEWIGKVLLGTAEPLILGQIGFLERQGGDGARRRRSGPEDVGRIDNVLVHPDLSTLRWCTLEVQAVYFSGDAMAREFGAIAEHTAPGIPFPAGRRRPDYRSSGPKRLMPQLQIKTPALRRWGKRMAVVVDEGFFAALGRMDDAEDVSNCDIAWFVVGYDESGGDTRLREGIVRYTTLEGAVEGLTAGRPLTLEAFEDRIRRRLEAVLSDRRTRRSPD